MAIARFHISGLVCFPSHSELSTANLIWHIPSDLQIPSLMARLACIFDRLPARSPFELHQFVASMFDCISIATHGAYDVQAKYESSKVTSKFAIVTD